MLSFIRRKKTVLSVLASFTKILDDLVQVAAENVATANGCNDKITDLVKQRDEAFAEAKDAHRIREKIETLVA